MTTFYFVRHGETPWNALHRMQGRADILLSERGKKQASFAAEYFKNIHIDTIYASPLKRAFETASIIRGCRKILIIPEKGLLETALGRWDGHTPEEIDELYPEEYDIWRNRPGEVRVDGGETFQQVQDRAWAAFQKILAREEGHTVLLVSHMGCLSTILLKAAGLPLNDLWKHPINNCGLARVDVEDEKMTISDWGKDDYIPEEWKMSQPFGRVLKKKNN